MKEGWKSYKINDVAEIVNGGTPKTGIKNFWDGNIPWITPADLGKLKNREVASTPRTISKLGLDKSSAKMFPQDSVILSTRAPIGHLAINKVPMSTNQGCRGIVPSANLNTVYLYYFLSANIDLLNELGTGATFRELSTKALASVEIPIPPLQEQQQIVAILDEAFSAIDQAKTNIERNIQNAKELFQSKLNAIFSQKGDGWEEKKLSDLGKTQTGTTPPTNDNSNYGDFIPFVKPAHFKPDGSIESGDCMLSESGLKKGRLFEANSVLMVCIGATIGKTGYTEIAVSSNQQINALTPNENYEPKLMYYALISPFVQKQVLIEGKGAQATLPIINKSKWEKIRVFVPSDKLVQTKIINQLDELNTSTKIIEGTYKTKLTQLAELKKAILQKAFAGELKLENIKVA